MTSIFQAARDNWPEDEAYALWADYEGDWAEIDRLAADVAARGFGREPDAVALTERFYAKLALLRLAR